MQVARQHFNLLKKLLITIVSWSMLLTPTANALAQQESEAPQQQETAAQEDASNESTHSADPKYCYQDSTNEECDKGLVYNCHLKSCVASNDNENYNREYLNCGGNAECLAELKADAEMFTSHQAADAKNLSAKDDIYRYISAAASIGQGCALLGVGGCSSDFGQMLAGTIIMATALMKILGDGYKKRFKGYKDQLTNLENNNEKGWSHNLQRMALQTEINILKDMEKAASDKMKHHNRISTMITIVGALAAICMALTWTGCSAANPCTGWTIGMAAVAFAMETKANQVARKAKNEAKKARVKVEAVLAKLNERYNNQYNPTYSQKSQIAGANSTIHAEAFGQGTNQNQSTVDEVQSERLKQLPETTVNLGTLGKNGENYMNTIGYGDIQEGYNKTRSTGNSKYINEALDKAAIKVSKASRRVLEIAAKAKNIKPNSKSAINAFLDPSSSSSKKFLNDTLTKNVSPIAMALNYRASGGNNASEALEQNTKPSTESMAVKYDSSSIDYLNKLKSQLKNLENLVEDDNSGVMAMSDFSDPTVNNAAIKQLNSRNANEKAEKVIHKDSGVSLWKIISNRYNQIKLKKGFN